MNHRTLGRTGLRVSELALGGLFMSSFGGAFEQSKAAVLRAIELGMNYIDTAPGYANSEEVLGNIIGDIKTPLIISTKLGGRPQPFDPKSKDALRKSVDESLRLLKRDQIDLLMVHEPDRPGQYDWWDDFSQDKFTGPVLDLLDELKSQGVIRFTGLGGTTAYELPRILRTGRFDVVLTAFQYSLLWREAEREVLPEAKRQKMGIVVGSPLQQGALAARYDQQIERGELKWMSRVREEQYKVLYRYLDEIQIPLPELALRFVLSNPDISCVLTGARSKDEVEQNVTAAEKGPLPREVIDRVNQIAAMVPFRPYGEPFSMPFRWAHKGPGLAQ